MNYLLFILLFTLSITVQANPAQKLEKIQKEIDLYSRQFEKLIKQCEEEQHKNNQSKCPGPHDEKWYKATKTWTSDYARTQQILKDLIAQRDAIADPNNDLKLSKEAGCEENSFETCYKGHNWSSPIELVCNKDDELRTLSNWTRLSISNYHSDITCDSFLKENLPQRQDDCIYKNCSLAYAISKKQDKSKSCFAISMDNQLTGFYKYWPASKNEEVTEDQFYFLLSQLKKKYGADIKQTKCNQIEVYSWDNTKSGLNILLFKEITKYDGKMKVFLRYIHTKTFLAISGKQKEDLANEKNKIDLEKEKSLETFGGGI